jgi:penicillin-binding protein 1A
VKTPVRAPAAQASAASSRATPNVQAGPPPVLTRRGADILVRVEKLLEDAAKKAARVSDNGTPAATTGAAGSAPAANGATSNTQPAAFTDSFASAGPGRPQPPRKN